MNSQTATFVMIKYPEPGRVKSRLARSIGDDRAAELYRLFIQDTLTKLEASGLEYYLAVHPPDAIPRFRTWLGQSYNLLQQNGHNLGERLSHGFLGMFEKGYEQVIALASDSPDLPIDILRKAVASLQNSDAVLGPTEDGGYYLIGFSQDNFSTSVFEDIRWSTETVFRETLARIESVTNHVHILPEWMDVDTQSDLVKFYENNNNGQSSLQSMRYLKEHPELLDGSAI